jgi:integrase
MGSVVERNGRWYIKYELPPGADGRRRQKTRACPADVVKEKQAKRYLAQVEAEVARGTYIEGTNISLEAYLGQWLDNHGSQLEASTRKKYRQTINYTINPMIGHLRLCAVKPLHIQQMYTMLLDEGLAPKTIRNIHGILHAALLQAVKWQLLPTNPTDVVEPPKAVKPDIQTARRGDIPKLVHSINGSIWRMPILLILATGMRRGEVCGLRWDDYDPENSILVVRRAVSQMDGTFIKSTKTDKARVIALPRSLVGILAEHRAQQIQTDWICANKDGSHMRPNSLGRAFKRMADALGINVTLHGLRHTQATELLMSGVPVKVVSERLGHSTSKITLDIYAHVLPHMQQQSAELVDVMLGLKEPEITVLDGGNSENGGRNVVKKSVEG